MAPSTTIRRLLKEVAELSPDTPNPNPAFYAAPVSDSNLHEWHFTLLGPPSPSPYAGGVYHGRISLPVQYPLKPPNFRFLTASGRFEVNREICLSISGFHEETWMPAWGVRTALTALRSFMAEAGTAGQVGGLEASVEVRKRLAIESKSWKCAECGKSNTEIMNEWWTICREKGVKVDEEEMGLEALPAGMAVQAIDRSQVKSSTKDNQDDTTRSQAKEQTTLGQVGSNDLTPPPPNEESKLTDVAKVRQSSTMATNPTTQSEISVRPTPTTPLQLPAQQALEQQQHISPQPADTSTPPPPAPGQVPQLPSQTRPQTQPQAQAQAQAHTQVPRQAQGQAEPQAQGPTITLDRAITAVFLALCIMILKKIFYPASQFNSTGGTNSREDWDLGLRREY